MQAILIVLIVLSSAFCAEAKKKSKHNRMALKDDLAAYWNMGQDPRLFPIHDQSFNGNHLTGVNFNPVPTPPTSLVEGKLGKAISFNGTQQHLRLLSSAGISHQGNEFTVAYWFKLSKFVHQDTLLQSNEWQATLEQSGVNFYIKVTIGGYADAPLDLILTAVPLEIGRWYFLTFGWYTNNGSFARAALDLDNAVKAARAVVLPDVLTFYVGTGLNGLFGGVADDLAIWRRAVSAEELTKIYNDGDGLAFSEWDKVRVCKEIKCCDD